MLAFGRQLTTLFWGRWWEVPAVFHLGSFKSSVRCQILVIPSFRKSSILCYHDSRIGQEAKKKICMISYIRISLAMVIRFFFKCSLSSGSFWSLKEQSIYSFPMAAVGEGNGNPLQYSCLENSMDRGAWQKVQHNWLTHMAAVTDDHKQVPKNNTHLLSCSIRGQKSEMGHTD